MIFSLFSLEAENFWTKMSPCKEATRMLPCLRRIKIVYLVVVDGETVLFSAFAQVLLSRQRVERTGASSGPSHRSLVDVRVSLSSKNMGKGRGKDIYFTDRYSFSYRDHQSLLPLSFFQPHSDLLVNG